MDDHLHNKKHAHALYSVGVDSQKVGLLAEYFSSLDAAWRASKEDLLGAGLSNIFCEKIIGKRGALDVDAEWEKLEKLGIQTVSLWEETYPALLREIYAPPPLLYFKGTLFGSARTIAIVGTRKPTPYGKDATQTILRELAPYGTAIISGLAYGIDTIAHTAALEHGLMAGAVLGCGLDMIYPSSNTLLAKKIAASGGYLLSEFPPGTQPLKQNFPQRNRIISGLSQGTVVIEAKEKSGALITAHFALEQGREVFAVPGSVFSSVSKGPHALLKNGAKLTESARDIIEELYPQLLETGSENEIATTDPQHRAILECLKERPLAMHEITMATNIEIAQLNAVLTVLELEGTIIKLTSGEFMRR